MSSDSRNPRAIALWSLGALLVGTLAGVLVTSWLHPAPDTSAIDNSTRTPLVTAQVELRPARAAASVSGRLRAPVLAAVNPTVATASTGSLTGADPGAASGQDAAAVPQPVLQVISRKVRSTGDSVSPGDLLAEVSGRPVYAFPLSAPLYRDLMAGSIGNDVRALQRMLARAGYYHDSADGRFRASTLAALQRLYRRDGYRLTEVVPEKPGLPLAETARIPGSELRVAAARPVGRQPTVRHPMLEVETRPAVLTARVDLLQADVFQVDDAVQVQVGAAGPVRSRVRSVSAFKEAGSSTPPGYDITVAAPKGLDVKATAGQPILIFEAGSVKRAPSVPLTAIRRDAGGGLYVLLAATGTEQAGAPRQVAVTVVAEVSGYAILAEDDGLPVGTSVVVAGG